MITYTENKNDSFWAQLNPRSKILFTILLLKWRNVTIIKKSSCLRRIVWKLTLNTLNHVCVIYKRKKYR